MRSDRVGDATQRMVFGLILLVLGVLFLLDKLGLIDMGNLGDYWPLVFVAIGLARVMQPPGSRGRGLGVVFIVVGVWWLLSNLDIVRYHPLHYWPAILILIGASMLWRAVGPPVARVAPPPPPPPLDQPSDGATASSSEAIPLATAASYESEPSVTAFAVMGGVERKSVARNFRGGALTAIMGGCALDLRQASMASGEAVIDAFAMWGGVEIKVPRDWQVVSKGMGVLGGFVDSTMPPPVPVGKVLVVRGVALMGGVETKN